MSEDDAAQALLSRFQQKAEPATSEEPKEDDNAESTDVEAEQAGEATAEATTEVDESESEVELDVAGEKFKLPAKLAEHAERIQSKVKDLERGAQSKFSEAAEIRKAAEAERQQIAELRKLVEARAPVLGEYQAVTAQLQGLQGIDLASLSDTDPVTAQKALAQMMQLQQKQAALVGKLRQADAEFSQKEAQVKSERASKGKEHLDKAIPGGWTAERRQAVTEYVSQRGLSAEAVEAANYDPVLVEVLYKAAQWDSLQAKKPEINKRANEAPKTLRPNAAGSTQSVQRANTEKAIQAHKKVGNLESAAAAILARARIRK